MILKGNFWFGRLIPIYRIIKGATPNPGVPLSIMNSLSLIYIYESSHALAYLAIARLRVAGTSPEVPA